MHKHTNLTRINTKHINLFKVFINVKLLKKACIDILFQYMPEQLNVLRA